MQIANVGPADYNYEETLSTLRYADRAKHIKNRTHINEDPKDALLRKFENEIEELKRLLAEENQSSIAKTEGTASGETTETRGSSGDVTDSGGNGSIFIGCFCRSSYLYKNSVLINNITDAEEDAADDEKTTMERERLRNLMSSEHQDTLHGIKSIIENQEKITSDVLAENQEKESALKKLRENVLTWKQHK